MAKNSFTDFVKTYENNKQAQKEDAKNTSESPKDAEGNVKKSFKRYGSMNEEQLMREMFSVAKQNKASGQLSAEELQKFYNQASPMLTVQQRNKLKSLINNLNNEI